MKQSLVQVGQVAFGVAALLVGAETLFGLIIMLGLGFNGANSVLLSLCLIAPLPVYLIAIRSKAIAAAGLWTVFFALWITRCFIRPRHFVSPFGWWWPESLLLAAVLVSFAAMTRVRSQEV